MSEHILAADVGTATLPACPLDPADVLAGSPRVSSAALTEVGGTEVGIWEITEGTVKDTEADEVFVVVSGEATLRFIDGSSVELGPGVVVRLSAGEQTEWEIRSTLRKVYVA